MSNKWTPWARAKLQEQRLLARTNSVVMRSNTQGMVKQLNSNVYLVDLEEGPAVAWYIKRMGYLVGM
jgi:hypothetical protein